MSLRTHTWSRLAWIVLSFSLLAQEIQAGDTPTNLVFILADNQSAEALAVYGNRDVETPNIDRLATEGIRFDSAFAANGLCSATRATLMSGLMPSAHGMHDAIPDPLLRNLPNDWNVVRIQLIIATPCYLLEKVGVLLYGS